MPRTIADFNAEYTYKRWREEDTAPVSPARGSVVRSAIFYALLIGMLLFAFIYSGDKSGGKRFGPFAYNTVLTNSMESVYPKGSLVVSWAVKPDEPLTAGLTDGNDIVFTREDGTVVVHRIIEIMENYEDTGQRAFRTQGVNNPDPDTWITGEVNVIGKVVWHVPVVGDILAFIAANIYVILVAIIGLFILTGLLKTVLKKEVPRE